MKRGRKMGGTNRAKRNPNMRLEELIVTEGPAESNESLPNRRGE